MDKNVPTIPNSKPTDTEIPPEVSQIAGWRTNPHTIQHAADWAREERLFSYGISNFGVFEVLVENVVAVFEENVWHAEKLTLLSEAFELVKLMVQRHHGLPMALCVSTRSELGSHLMARLIGLVIDVHCANLRENEIDSVRRKIWVCNMLLSSLSENAAMIAVEKEAIMKEFFTILRPENFAISLSVADKVNILSLIRDTRKFCKFPYNGGINYNKYDPFVAQFASFILGEFRWTTECIANEDMTYMDHHRLTISLSGRDGVMKAVGDEGNFIAEELLKMAFNPKKQIAAAARSAVFERLHDESKDRGKPFVRLKKD